MGSSPKPVVYIFDIECDGFLHQLTRIHCAVFKSIDGEDKKYFEPHQMQDMIKFMDTVDVLIGHNILGYDLPAIRKVLNYEFKGKKCDTLIMSRILNPKRTLPPHAKDRKAGPHSIYAWGVRVGVDKPEHEDWGNYSPEMLHRCSEDVEINLKVYHELLNEAKGGNWRNAFLLSFKLFEHLADQEEYGWLADKPYMLKKISQLDRIISFIDKVVTPQLPQILEIEEQKINGEYKYVSKPFLKSGQYNASVSTWYARNHLQPADWPVCGPFTRVTFRTTDLNSNAETKDFLLKAGWEPLEWNTNDDGERTSPKLSKDDPFEGIQGRVGKYVARRVQCRQRKSIIEGLIEVIREDGRIPGSVASMAVTGRLTHRNIVNIPGAKSFFGKQMRKMFTSGEGKVIVGCDSDACQIRMLAGRMNDPAYTETVINGKKEDGTDMHTVNQLAAGLPSRDDAKTFFYGFLFGAGDAKVGKIVKGTAAHGKKLKEQFMQGLPALGALMNKLQKEWQSTAKRRYNAKFNRMEYYDGVITGLDGRPIIVPSEHQVLVYCLQSDEAIFMAAAYNKMNMELRKRYKYGEDFGFVVFMHDEAQVECKKEIAHEVGKIMARSIEWAGQFFKIPCPHKGDYTVGRNWFETH